MTSNGFMFPFSVTSLFQLALSGRFWNPRRCPKEGDLYAMQATHFFQSVSETLTICQFRTNTTLKNTQSSFPSSPASPMFYWERLLCCSCNSVIFHLFCFSSFVLKGAHLTWTYKWMGEDISRICLPDTESCSHPGPPNNSMVPIQI